MEETKPQETKAQPIDTRPTTNMQRWLYGLSMLGIQIPAQMVSVYLLFFYTTIYRKF